MNLNSNPLSQFFRQPAIYIRLPSQGKGWPTGSLDLGANGELPVYPMTAMDEITYRTPDALFNGEAVTSVIQSCIPNIRDAWSIPACDLDTILVSIRIASYGNSMDIDTTCPACQSESQYGLDLRTVINKIRSDDYTKPLVVGDLTIYFRPLNYREITANSVLQFEQQKTVQILSDANTPDENKVQQINRMMRSMMEATVTVLSQSIREIRTPTAVVQETDQILEFMQKCDRAVFTQIKDRVIQMREVSEIRPLKMRCQSCQHEYEQAFTLDNARFFVSDS
jgi:hypothetical protein